MATMPIPWPTTALPGRLPGESQGTLVNAYAVKIGQQINIRRVAGLRRYLTSTATALKRPRGQLEVEGRLIHVWDGEAFILNADGSNHLLFGSMPGDYPVTIARNMRQTGAEVIIVGEEGAREVRLVDDTISAHPSAGLENVNSVEYFSGYFIFTEEGGLVIASELQSKITNTATSNQLSSYAADKLWRTKSIGNSLAVMGSQSIEFWVDVGASPFPLQRQQSIDVGLLSRWAVAGGSNVWENGLLWVAGDYTVRQLNGYQAQVISTDDVSSDIRAISASYEDLVAQVYVFNAQPIFSLSSRQWTWEYNLASGSWHKRESYAMPFWRAVFAVNYDNRWIAQDVAVKGTNALMEITPDAYDEDGERLRWMIESAPLKEFPANIRIPSIDIDMTVGLGQMGTPAPFQTDPVVMVSWSHNGGAHWSNPLARSMGSEGRYATKVSVRNIGRSTHQGVMFRLEVTDPVWIQLTSAISMRTQPSRPRGVNQ
ncbi:MAG: hypothetical protein ABWY63_01700 [Hyphomicrobiaceae bacterium]